MDVHRDRLTNIIETLCREPRPLGSSALETCREFVSEQFMEFGWRVTPHPFQAENSLHEMLTGYNLLAVHADHPLGDRSRFVIGAHLDSVPGSPGADDNASAVAALLEVARLLPEHWPAETELDLELVCFDLEENGMLGGAEHAELIERSGVDLSGMVSLEMLGYCDERANTQMLPAHLKGLYPDTGNFIALVGSRDSGTLLETFASGVRKVDDLPLETLHMPDNGETLQASRLSDHSPFWDLGYPALMMTDTSFLRNPYYHTQEDKPETLDMDFLCKVTQGVCRGIHAVLSPG